MRRIAGMFLALGLLELGSGCGGLYRSLGHIPGIAPTDYAFSFFCGTASQLYPMAPDQVASSMREALGDLGFTVLEPPAARDDGVSQIRARTPDGRPADITITPQNSVTNVRVEIGPAHLGDYELSRDLLRRVALNFGTGLRTTTPIDRTLPRRINVWRGLPPRIENPPPKALEGEGLRPDETRIGTTGEASAVPGLEGAAGQSSPDASRGFIPTRDYPNPPDMPSAPFPYTPFNNNSP